MFCFSSSCQNPWGWHLSCISLPIFQKILLALIKYAHSFYCHHPSHQQFFLAWSITMAASLVSPFLQCSPSQMYFYTAVKIHFNNISQCNKSESVTPQLQSLASPVWSDPFLPSLSLSFFSRSCHSRLLISLQICLRLIAFVQPASISLIVTPTTPNCAPQRSPKVSSCCRHEFQD